ncbi:SDR family NAD(P)-dependent oxidoreductase [Pseudenhygromyxa sp. WMMC2535]|uniref:SDR family NAD(P)-dependent oxidoreductase n=1 Tax=Pseudenhygromyxa sp. WMMC2535 TaxID=2712867 RepID=UPI001557E9E0|nr:SDR family NAD(P)-dependent oxidoreductase [Pseudenhygromyxa sp. WMMC2535]NVB40506.1 SDR family NAD(P)-dependent oxidoreductase [Pseudenhygromyxa sp. WMMC2535]
MPAPRLFCFGLGYCAVRLARRLETRGFEIVGTTRDVAAKRAALAREGVGEGWSLVAFDGERPLDAAGSEALRGATHLLHSIMPGEVEGGEDERSEGERVDPALRWHAAALDELRARGQLRWLAYLSTTGVYGDHGGAWVDEDMPRRPSKARARRRVLAEDAWLARGADVFRLAGIYGPGRSALERVEGGRARRVIKAGKVFNRVHVDDIVEVLTAALTLADGCAGPGRAFNVADGNPAGSDEVLAYAAQLLGLPPPPAVAFEDAELSAMARSFWQDNLRVDARRVRERLGVEFAYPDYRAGLEACLRARG